MSPALLVVAVLAVPGCGKPAAFNPPPTEVAVVGVSAGRIARAANARQTLARYEALLKDNAVSRQDYDNAASLAGARAWCRGPRRP